jgi:FdhD protein
MYMQSVVSVTISKVNGQDVVTCNDELANEEPLELRLQYQDGIWKTKSISITMRTPGNDAELALGFLYTEGIITDSEQVAHIATEQGKQQNVTIIKLQQQVFPDIARLERNFYTSSSCGVCGKTSIEAVMSQCPVLDVKDKIRIDASTIYKLPNLLQQQQKMFRQTGGIHGCALFGTDGQLLLMREDVGRHNAMDKLIGAAMNQHMLPLQQHIILLSGRASFELMQKAAMAGVKVVAAVGAPSALAVQMANEWGMTLIGFLRKERFNIYTGMHRVTMGHNGA